MPNDTPRPGDSIAINRRYLDSLLVEGRIVGAVHPNAETVLLGHSFDTPVMTAALSHLKPGMPSLAEAAKLAGVTRGKIHKWIRGGLINTAFYSRKLVRISRTEFDEFLTSRETEKQRKVSNGIHYQEK